MVLSILQAILLFLQECSESSPLNMVVTSQDSVLQFSSLCLFLKASCTSLVFSSAFLRAALWGCFFLQGVLSPHSQNLCSLTGRAVGVLPARALLHHTVVSLQDSWLLIAITTVFFFHVGHTWCSRCSRCYWKSGATRWCWSSCE